MIEITTRNQPGKRENWKAVLTQTHPMHGHMKAGDSVAHGDTEEELRAELGREGYTQDERGDWTYTLPAYARGPALDPYTDPDGIARLGPV